MRLILCSNSFFKRFDVFNRLRNCMRLFHTHCYNTLSLWHRILDVHNLVLRFLSWNPCKQKMILLKIQRRIHGTPLLVGVIRYTLHKGMNLHAEAVLIHIPRSIARYYFIIFFSKFYSPILKSNRLRFFYDAVSCSRRHHKPFKWYRSPSPLRIYIYYTGRVYT